MTNPQQMTVAEALAGSIEQMLEARWTLHDEPMPEDCAEVLRRTVATLAALAQRVEAAESRAAELEAARMAYASEFPLNADGEPDVGSIHANIRALKARAAGLERERGRLRADAARYRWLRDAYKRNVAPRVIAMRRTPFGSSYHEAKLEGDELDAAIDAAAPTQGAAHGGRE